MLQLRSKSRVFLAPGVALYLWAVFILLCESGLSDRSGLELNLGAGWAIFARNGCCHNKHRNGNGHHALISSHLPRSSMQNPISIVAKIYYFCVERAGHFFQQYIFSDNLLLFKLLWDERIYVVYEDLCCSAWRNKSEQGKTDAKFNRCSAE